MHEMLLKLGTKKILYNVISRLQFRYTIEYILNITVLALERFRDTLKIGLRDKPYARSNVFIAWDYWRSYIFCVCISVPVLLILVSCTYKTVGFFLTTFIRLTISSRTIKL